MTRKDINVLFVCLGNICRSPLAEAIFQFKVAESGLTEKFYVDSCGTGDFHIGELPDERTLKIAEKNGVPINHRARQFDSDDFELFNHIIVMDKSNFNNVTALDGGKKYDHIELMRTYDENADSIEVPDPYWGGLDGFQNVYDILDRSTDNFLNSLSQKYGLSN